MAMRTSLGEGAGFGEPEMDANMALTDLDKGLRSTKIGEQTEAIVRFPALFERYPFPILINSAFLKLADVFRTGTNFLRLWILRVCQQCERHLEKIVSIDEFIRRIFSVIHSNDPIARSLTLRTIGSLAILIPERKQIHHSIRVALDSHDRVEVSAAIYAAASFAKKSKTFGTTMCTKISSMIQKLSTPMDMKLRLVSIFQYMHHDVTTATLVRKLCEELLTIYPSKEFVITTSCALTQLAAATKSDFGEQITLLLKNLEDLRLSVKLSTLKNLKCLAEEGGHLWEPKHIAGLLDFITSYTTVADDRMEVDGDDQCLPNINISGEIVYRSLAVISSLARYSVTFTSYYCSDKQIHRLLESNIKSPDINIVLKTIEIGTNIAVNSKIEDTGPSRKLIEMTQLGLESLVLALCKIDHTAIEENRNNDLKKCFKYGVSICKARPDLCSWLMNVAFRLLKDDQLESDKQYIICETLGAIGSCNQKGLQDYLPNVLEILANMNSQGVEKESKTIALLVAIVLQIHEGYTLDRKVQKILEAILKESDPWMLYKIARSSLRFGQPDIAKKALDGSSAKVSSESFHFWLSALHSVSKAEYILLNSREIPSLLHRLGQASSLYLQAVVSLKAASSNTMNLAFQIEYVRIRAEMMIAFKTFLVSCGALQFSPPPAIAPNIANANRDELLKCGRVVTQLRKSIREFQNLSEMYGRLYQTAFDADNESLFNIQTLQQLCLLVVRAVEKIAVSKEHPSFSSSDQAFEFCLIHENTESTSSGSLLKSCNLAVEVLSELKKCPVQTVSQKHVECLKECIKILVETPVTYPRFFFQTLQNTRAKIAVSPQPRVPGESVVLVHGNNLALKVEGVIEQRGGKGRGGTDTTKTIKLFRRPKAIRVTVVAVPTQTPSRTHIELNKMNPESLTLVEEVKPHKDFFTAQFLLNGCPSGTTNVTIDTALIDFEGRVWITGPRATLSVRVYEESASGKSITPASMTSSMGSVRVPQSVGSSTPPLRF